MASSTATAPVAGDKYRSHIYGEGEKNTQWRFGGPPNYDVVNKLFEEGRTHVWPKGSREEIVQNLVKTFEMEMFHKVRAEDFKTVNTAKFTMTVNGGAALDMKEISKRGGYNVFLQTSMPASLRGYDPATQTSESSHEAFTKTFPRGFALEIVEVYAGPPVIVYKFRHWAFMEGPFLGHAPTGEMAQFFGIGIFTVDETMKIEKVEFFYDAGRLLGSLLKGLPLEGSSRSVDSHQTTPAIPTINCPFFSK